VRRPPQRLFPPRVPSASTADTSEPSVLQLLGRRMERLFFVGLLLTGLSFAEMYLTAANAQFAKDRSSAAITAMLKRTQNENKYLNQLYSAKPPVVSAIAQPAPPPKRGLDAKAQRRVAIRSKLGLPPELPTASYEATPNTPLPSPPPTPTYASELQKIIDDAVKSDNVSADDLQAYNRPATPPDNLVKQLEAASAAADKQPFEVWGIRTPRIIEFEYAGSNFQFPYVFLSMVLIALLGPLVAGWQTSLYMTRQREIHEIAKTANFSSIFPHILNFIPVSFARFSAAAAAATPQSRMVEIVVLATLRVLVILVLVTPMLIAYGYSLFQFWGYSSAVNTAIPFLVYIFVQTFVLVAQEAFSLGRKYFVEI
jgi:hypothetical protein